MVMPAVGAGAGAGTGVTMTSAVGFLAGTTFQVHDASTGAGAAGAGVTIT